MLQPSKTGLIIAVLALTSGVVQAEWRGPVLNGNPQTFADCTTGGDFPCVRLWRDMNAQERAELWPYLDDVARASHWREMTKRERDAMQAQLCDADREAIRHRFSVERAGNRAGHHGAKPKLCNEDRSLMRAQIMEVHMKFAKRAPESDAAEGEADKGTVR